MRAYGESASYAFLTSSISAASGPLMSWSPMVRTIRALGRSFATPDSLSVWPTVHPGLGAVGNPVRRAYRTGLAHHPVDRPPQGSRCEAHRSRCSTPLRSDASSVRTAPTRLSGRAAPRSARSTRSSGPMCNTIVDRIEPRRPATGAPVTKLDVPVIVLCGGSADSVSAERTLRAWHQGATQMNRLAGRLHGRG